MTIFQEIFDNSDPVKTITGLDLEAVKKEVLSKNEPLLIKGLTNHWKATKNWDLDYFMNLEGDKDVLFLTGNYIHDGNNFKKSTFKDYILKLKEFQNKSSKEFNQYLTALNIFNLFPDLKKDIDFSFFEKHTHFNIVSAWIGPANTVSGFHADTVQNMFAQIYGRKIFLLAAYKYKKNMYPSSKYIPGAIASQVDINDFDESKHPNFKKTPFKSVVLEPGDVLYVPRKWWHYVQSVDTSISVSNFGYSNFEKNTLAIAERVKLSLHKRGYYKPKNCFCCD